MTQDHSAIIFKHLLIENADSSDPVWEKLHHMELGDMGRLGHRLAAAAADQQAVDGDGVGVALPRVDSPSVDARLGEPAKLVWQLGLSGEPAGGRGPVEGEGGGLEAAWQLKEPLGDVEVV